LTQDTYLRAVRGFSRFRPRGADRAWLFQIARNLLFNHHRAAANKPQTFPLDEQDGGAAPTETSDMHRALGKLDERDRDAFLLRELGGLSYGEIAKTVGASEGSVRNRIYRARMNLHAGLSHNPRTKEGPR